MILLTYIEIRTIKIMKVKEKTKNFTK